MAKDPLHSTAVIMAGVALGCLLLVGAVFLIAERYNQKHSQEDQEVLAYIADLKQERDNWRAAATFAFERLAHQDLLVLHKLLHVDPLEMTWIGLRPGEDLQYPRVVWIPHSKPSHQIHFKFTPEGHFDDVRLLPTPAAP